jgi:hypothetical protein
LSSEYGGGTVCRFFAEGCPGGVAWVYQKTDRSSCGYHFMQQLEPLPRQFRREARHACYISARTVEARDQPVRHRIATVPKYDGYRRARRLGRYCGQAAASRHDDGHTSPHQFERHSWQLINVIFCRLVVDHYVAAFDIADFTKALPECTHKGC